MSISFVSSIERSLPFYQGLLEAVGWLGPHEVVGEQGETIYYLVVEAPGVATSGAGLCCWAVGSRCSMASRAR